MNVLLELGDSLVSNPMPWTSPWADDASGQGEISRTRFGCQLVVDSRNGAELGSGTRHTRRDVDLGTVGSLIVIVIIVMVGWWLLRKILHIGFIFAVGLLLLFGWWFFFVR